uniref:Uncharacterized protein n=1 Tax=Anguilla anguilla TaxID=7936 RepID=A0A0E9QMW5_ANGAN
MRYKTSLQTVKKRFCPWGFACWFPVLNSCTSVNLHGVLTLQALPDLPK